MMRIKGLSEEEDLYLKTSLGIQKKDRFYSPMRVANLLNQALQAGEEKIELVKKLPISMDMTNKILRILKIQNDSIGRSISWGPSGSNEISMSTASELAKLENSHDQLKVFEGILKHQLSSKEIKELVTLYSRSGQTIEECINQIKDAKPKTIHTYVFIGKITSSTLCQKLATIPGLERNRLLRDILDSHVSSVKYTGAKLEKRKFLIIGDQETEKQLASLEGGFEDYITNLLVEETGKKS